MTSYSINCARTTSYPYMRKDKIRFLPHTKINPGRWGKIKEPKCQEGGGRLKNHKENNQKNGKTHTKNLKPFSRKEEY